MKKNLLFIVSLLVVISVLLSACGAAAPAQPAAPAATAAPAQPAAPAATAAPAAPAATGKMVGISMPTKTSTRWISDGNSMVKSFEALGYKADLQFADNDIQNQLSQLENMITKGANVLIIAAIDGSTMSDVLQKAHDAGILVISYDRLITKTPNVDYYATFDNFGVGVIQGTQLVTGLGLKDGKKGPFNVELFGGSPDDTNAGYFYNGAMSVIQPYIDSKQIVIQSGQMGMDKVGTLRWLAATAQARMDNLLSAYYTDKKVDGVLSPYDGLSIGILSSLKGVGYCTATQPCPVVTGQDAEVASVKSIIAGEQTYTVFKDTRQLAAQTAKMVDQALKGEKVDVNDTKTYDNGVKVVPSYLLTPISIDVKNYQKELVDTGYIKAEDLGVAAAPAAPAAAGKIVGISMPTKTSTRWISDGNSMVKSFEALGYKTDLQFADNDIQNQLSQLENMITKGANVLVIAAIDGSTMSDVLQKAHDAGILVISYDRLITKTPNVDYYATFDNFGVGVIQGTQLVTGLGLKDGKKGPFNVELFGGSPDDTNAGYFYNGAMSVIQPYIDSKQIVIQSGQMGMDKVGTLRWLAATAQARMDNLLSAYYTDKKVDGVLSPYDGLSIGILSSLKGVGYCTATQPCPVVTGQDAEVASVKSIIAGEQTYTVFKDTRQLAAQTAKMVDQALKGEKVDVNDTKTYDNGVKVVPSYLLTPISIDVKNYQKELVDTGYIKAEELPAAPAAPAAPSTAGKIVGISMPTKTSTRWISDGNSMVKSFEALGYKTDLQFADNDIQNQLSQLENMITKGANVLIIAAIDGSTMSDVLQKAHDAGILVISYDRLITKTPNVDYYATFDNFGVGVIQGTQLVTGLGLKDGKKGPFNVELFGGSPDDTNAGYFYNGAMSVIQPYIDSKQIVIQSGQMGMDKVGTLRWLAATAQARMDNLLSAYYTDKKVDGVLSPYDGLSIGILSSLKGVGYCTATQPCPVVTGQDAEVASVKSIVAGEQTYTVFKDTRQLAAQTAKMVDQALKGEKVDVNDTKTYDNGVKVVPSYLLTPISIDVKNYQKELVDTGYIKAEELK